MIFSCLKFLYVLIFISPKEHFHILDPRHGIRSMNNVDSFKTVLKTHFFNIAFQDVN